MGKFRVNAHNRNEASIACFVVLIACCTVSMQLCGNVVYVIFVGVLYD